MTGPQRQALQLVDEIGAHRADAAAVRERQAAAVRGFAVLAGQEQDLEQLRRECDLAYFRAVARRGRVDESRAA